MTSHSALYAILIGPLFVVPGFMIVQIVPYLLGLSGNSSFPNLNETLPILVYILPGTYFFTIIIGLPLALILERLKIFNLFFVALISLTPATVFFGFMSQNLTAWLFLGGLSVFVATACYFVNEFSYNKSLKSDLLTQAI